MNHMKRIVKINNLQYRHKLINLVQLLKIILKHLKNNRL
jgi:hypothetical protein